MADPERTVLSDLELALLIFHGQYLAVADEGEVSCARRRLQDLGLLQFPMDGDHLDDALDLTKRGEIHLEHLLRQKLPVQVWSHRD